jgi:hypothetical protein
MLYNTSANVSKAQKILGATSSFFKRGVGKRMGMGAVSL